MRAPVAFPPGAASWRDVTLCLGDVHASRDPALIRTLLGSCIAVCLWDPPTHAGGMNHFMLPRGAAGDDDARFGVHAMDRLIGALMKLGADRRRLLAKVFGGAHVLDVEESPAGVPRQNVEFIREYLALEGLTVAAEDLGGYEPREVHFYTENGRARVKHVTSAHARSEILRRERRPAGGSPAAYGDVTLFEGAARA